MENANKLTQMEASQARMAAVLDENKRLINELKLMQGLVQKVSQQSNQACKQIIDLTKRGMEQNLILFGVDDSLEIQDAREEAPKFTARERPKYLALEFFQKVMKLEIALEDVWKAHRSGPFREGKVKPLIVKLSYSAKELIMEHLSSLKGLKNPLMQQTYFISEQIPEAITETKKQVSSRLKNLKEVNDMKPKEERKKIYVVNNNILVDGEVVPPEITSPQPSDLFLNAEAQRQVDAIQAKMVEVDREVISNSDFRALAGKVHSLEEVKQAYIAAAQRYPSVDHLMMAYAFKDSRNGKVHSGACDDREYGAGIRIRKVIFEQKARNTVVFVLRKFGGIHMGFNRFNIIEDMAQKAINLLPF